MAYAKTTNVNPERSQEEIKSILRRYGCDRFGVMEERNSAFVMFTISGLNIQVEVPMPARDSNEFTTTDTGRDRSELAAWRAYEQAVRSRWRSLLLAIKAKLEAVECGISTVEIEFMPFIVLHDGSTVHQRLLPVLQDEANRNAPLMLPGGKA